MGHEFGGRWAVPIILKGCQVTLWFVQGEVSVLFGKLDEFSIQEYTVVGGYALSERGYTVVDLHPASGDQGLRLAARRGSAAAGKKGLEAHSYSSFFSRASLSRSPEMPWTRSRTREISSSSTRSSSAGKSSRLLAPARRKSSVTSSRAGAPG